MVGSLLLSFVDIFSDVYLTVQYFQESEWNRTVSNINDPSVSNRTFGSMNADTARVCQLIDDNQGENYVYSCKEIGYQFGLLTLVFFSLYHISPYGT